MSNRATGRTTRMLQYAVEEFMSGKTVIVYGASFKHCEELLEASLRNVSFPNSNTVIPFVRRYRTIVDKHNTRHYLRFIPISTSFDCVLMKEVGYCEDTVHLVDHYAIEVRYSLMLQELTRWDATH